MKFFQSFLIPALAIAACCRAEISQVNQMNDVVQCFKDADKETLALFDIDLVILQPKDPAFQMANMKRFSPICKKVVQQIPSDKRDIFFILTTLSSDPVLIDPRLPVLLSDLKERNVPTMALTGNFTGKFGSIDNMEEWKIRHLAQFGIDFSKGAPSSDQIVFRDLPSFRENYSTYTKGILFVNGSTCPKGDALVAYLKKTGHAPSQVIFIDDREDNLKSVEASLQQFDPSIKFKGLHFTGAKDYPSKEISEQQFEARWLEVAGQALNSP
ncbi:MAG: DUF2608 domain-containing protein [Verrucomicrobia bacterium]|nr:DUF2608 domain-containing protein [Verrucomicrobiota bacterium]